MQEGRQRAQMSLDVVHAHDGQVGHMRRSHDLDPPISGTTHHTPESFPIPHGHSSPRLPASQESHHSTISKQSAPSSEDVQVTRQITPLSSQSRHDSSSPQTASAYYTSPGAPSGALASYQPLANHDAVEDIVQSPVSVTKLSPPRSVESSLGQKPTASGFMKTARPTYMETHAQDGINNRARTGSAASHSSHVGELSAQLRARLAYAKVKVQHGWESRTLDEIEAITSMPTSPVSVQTNSTRAFLSPRSSKIQQHADGSGIALSSEKTTLPPDRPLTAPSRHLQYGPPYSAPSQLGYTGSAVGYTPARGSLAPPVDFSNPRRSNNGHTHRPGLATDGFQRTLSASSSSSSRSPLPSTPPIRPPDQAGPLKTPSQRTMEQDAIETLLFMSSPNNSATFPRPPGPPRQPFPQLSHAPVTATGPTIQHQHAHPGESAHGTSSQALSMLRKPASMIGTNKTIVDRRHLEEGVLAGADLHDSQGIDIVLDEMRRRALVEGEEHDSSDDEELVSPR